MERSSLLIGFSLKVPQKSEWLSCVSCIVHGKNATFYFRTIHKWNSKKMVYVYINDFFNQFRYTIIFQANNCRECLWEKLYIHIKKNIFSFIFSFHLLRMIPLEKRNFDSNFFTKIKYEIINPHVQPKFFFSSCCFVLFFWMCNAHMIKSSTTTFLGWKSLGKCVCLCSFQKRQLGSVSSSSLDVICVVTVHNGSAFTWIFSQLYSNWCDWIHFPQKKVNASESGWL